MYSDGILHTYWDPLLENTLFYMGNLTHVGW